MPKKLFLLALNEFNGELLKSAAQCWNLKHLQSLLELNYSQTQTQDTYESNFLEPWVQWVSVQSGLPSRQHGIKHLGDIPNLDVPQLWETLSKNGIRCGIWGALNASLRQKADACFFMPDPWTFSQNAYPKRLQGFLDFPRYLAKNYLGFKVLKLFKSFSFFTLSLLRYPSAIVDCFKNLPLLLSGVWRFPKEIFVYFSFAELIMARVFFEERKRNNVSFSMFFINGIAHLQHYDWFETKLKDNKRFQYGFQCVDRILKLYSEYKEDGESIIGMNALSQCNTNHEAAWNSYKLRNPQKLFELLGLKFNSVEALMSYDGHILCDDKESALKNIQLLSMVKVEGASLFLAEINPKDATKIFYRSQFYSPLKESAEFNLGPFSFKFFDHFKCLTRRTGKHISNADLYTSLENLPHSLLNHDVNQVICDYFEVPQEKLESANKAKELTATGRDLRQ